MRQRTVDLRYRIGGDFLPNLFFVTPETISLGGQQTCRTITQTIVYMNPCSFYGLGFKT